ncbi:MAG: hypothetical protein IJO75_01270 [Clostridia bacterium]|nr:hypothetical protein [Clostridia bacterium]
MEKRFTDVDEVLIAIEKARKHAEERGKPLNLSRIALYLGMTTQDLYNVVEGYEKSDDEGAQAVVRVLKMAKQESRADLEDCLADKGNTTGYIFLGKVNHGMVETTRAEVKFKGVQFVGEDEIPD